MSMGLTLHAPITGTPERPLLVVCYGPGRPKSGGAFHTTKVDENGWFRMRVVPGRNYPFMSPDLWKRTEGRADIEAGVEVKDGETIRLDFRITPPKPR
jgi:hypothetical protein